MKKICACCHSPSFYRIPARLSWKDGWVHGDLYHRRRLGNACLIVSPTGQSMLVDAGTPMLRNEFLRS